MQKSDLINWIISGISALIVAALFTFGGGNQQQMTFGAPTLSLFKNATTTGLTADYICLGGTCQSSFSAGAADGTFSTTSAQWFVHSSTTIPKTYTANTFSLLNAFANATSTLFTSTTAWVGTLNLTNSLTVANGGTGLTAVGASSTVLTTDGTSAVWQKIGLTAAVSGILPVLNGGTGVSTFGGTNTVLYTTAADTLSAEAAFTYNAGADLLTMVNASTTNLTASQSFFINGVRQPQYMKLSGGKATTTWSGTTSTQILARENGVLKDIQCDLDAGTLNVQVYVNSTAVTPMVPASTTAGIYTFTANNTFSSGDTIKYDYGTPASSPKKADCTALAYPTQ